MSITVEWTEALVERERRRTPNKEKAIAAVARLARVSPGQIEGLLRGRVKDPKISFAERIRAAFIAETAREIDRLSHELDTAKKLGIGADDRAFLAAKAALARLQNAMGNAP